MKRSENKDIKEKKKRTTESMNKRTKKSKGEK